MNFKVLTIFPEFFESATRFSLLGKAQEKGVISVEAINLRDFAEPRAVHKMVDDKPFGGGPGMVMMVEPVYKAIKELKTSDVALNRKVIIFSPKGQKYDQVMAEKLVQECDELIMICPHYEGFDERILEFVDYEVSIGDYVLTGGEIPALIVIDSVARLVPGVIGNFESTQSESFSELKDGKRNLEHPQYTRPALFVDDEGKEHKVPEVLLSGNHAEIEKWRSANSE
jgi:tRNA (guanine37-N1)-methyltransferase